MNRNMAKKLLIAVGISVLFAGMPAVPANLDTPGIPVRRMRTARPFATDAPAPQTPLQTAWLHIIDTPSLRHASISATAYDLTTHRSLAAIHADWRETPASLMKLFTSAAALHTLGPSYRYRTEVRASGATTGAPPTLYLVGGGDP